MTSGPTYGQGFIELEPQLSRDFLSKINSQLDRAFSNIKLDVDDSSIKNIRSQLDLVEGAAGEAAKEVAKIADKAAASTDDFKLLAKSLDLSEDEARRLTIQVGKAQVEARQLDDATQRVAKSLGLSQSEARRFADQMNRAADSNAAIGRLEGSLGRIRSSLSTMAVSAVAFFGVRGLVGAATSARDAFIDLGESVNAVEVVFGEGADTIFAFSDQVAQSAGLAKSEFQQMSTVLGAALQNAGLNADEAANKTIILTQRAADLASVFNTDVSEALGAIQAALRGEGDPIERFGVSLSAAAVDAEAAALGFSKVGGEFDNTAKAAARISLIMEQTNRVAGDFANTSDSLANRQRIAAAEMENVRAELGEALLPVFEALVDIGPEVVEGLKDLAPALSAMAVSAGELATSTPGVLDFMDALHLITDLPRGFGQLGDIAQANIGIFTGVLDTLDEIARQDFSNLGDNFDTVGDAAQRTFERINTQGLIDDLREGGDAATVLANRLVDVGKKGKLSPEFIRNLREIAGVDLETSAAVLGAMVDQADRLGLSADEIAMLNVEFARLRNEILPVGNELAQATRAMEEMASAGESAIPRTTRGFDILEAAAAEAGLSLADLITGTEDLPPNLQAMLDPATELALKLDLVRTGAITAGDAFKLSLTPALVDVAKGLEDLNKDGKVSLAEFTTNLQQAAQDFLDFQVNLAAIAQISPELAAALGALPDEVQAAFLAEGFAKADEAAIMAAAEGITGSPKQISAAILDIYLAGLGKVDRNDPEAVAEWLEIIEGTIDIPGITKILAANFQPALDASFADLEPPDMLPVMEASIGTMSAGAIAASLDEVLDASFADLEIPDLTPQVLHSIDGWNSATLADAVENALFANVDIDLTEEGIQSRATYLAGLSTPKPGEVRELRDSIVNTLDDAVFADSPPKLFRWKGEDAADAYWSGFEGAAMDFPGVDLTKSFTAAKAASIDISDSGTRNGPLIGEMTVNNPIGEPTEESVQSALIEVAISPIVRNAGAGSSI